MSQPINRWLSPQSWHRDTPGPILSLGRNPAFDDMHIFAPCVARIGGKYHLWYCGSRDRVSNRIFRLGLATSPDGRVFKKHLDNPVFQFPDGQRSILTPTLLRNPDGSILRENERLRMWFSATDFQDKSGLHTLHESTSRDGIRWAAHSDSLMSDAYAPTIIKDNGIYRMWYTDVGSSPWLIRYAHSKDGRRWNSMRDPVIQLDQKWEKTRLFYPTVLKVDGVYLMWYGSYWAAHRNKTALGFAVSADGLKWHKHPDNPVFRPDPSRPWESHYTTSQSVIRLKDGSFRMWYATRPSPPFEHKYFAIGTAHWDGP